MSHHEPRPPTKVLIAGAGFIGQATAALFKKSGTDFSLLVRREASAVEWKKQGISAYVGDVTQVDSLKNLPSDFSHLIHCMAPGRGGGAEEYEAVYLQGARHLTARFSQARLIYTGSTSVYAQIDGSWVDESSPTEPSRATGKILRQTEDHILDHGGTVLRLAGLYGGTRSVLLRQFLRGEAQIDVRRLPPMTPDGRWINQLHRDDAASAIAHVIEQSLWGRLFIVSDGTPLTQRMIYTELAQRFSRPLPPEREPDQARKRGWSHKRLSPTALVATGWAPTYPDWLTALDHDPLLVPLALAEL
jgi:nucleoside-diphosphate-sugar epimerase